MAWRVVKNPETQNYQIYSTVVDAFILDKEITRDELAEFWKEEFGRHGMEGFEYLLQIVEEREKCGSHTYADSLMWHTHSMYHAYGAQCNAEDAKLHPDTCRICADMQRDMKHE